MAHIPMLVPVLLSSVGNSVIVRSSVEPPSPGGEAFDVVSTVSSWLSVVDDGLVDAVVGIDDVDELVPDPWQFTVADAVLSVSLS